LAICFPVSRLDHTLPLRIPSCWEWEIPNKEEVRVHLIASGYSEELAGQQVGKYWESRRFAEFHRGRCAICGWKPPSLVTDHSHATGLVRGFLCRGCNASEGGSATPIMAKYRARNPATILDYREMYWSGFGGYVEPAPEQDIWKENPTVGLL